jgi:methyl-accepting chemotaxis protein
MLENRSQEVEMKIANNNSEKKNKTGLTFLTDMSISAKIILSFVMILVFLVVVIFVYISNIRVIVKQTKAIENELGPIDRNANALLYFMYNMNNTKDVFFEKEFKFQLQGVKEELLLQHDVYNTSYEKMLVLVEQKPEIKTDIEEVNGYYQEFMTNLQEIFKIYDSSELEIDELRSETQFQSELAEERIKSSIAKLQNITVKTNEDRVNAIKTVNTVVDRLRLFMLIAFSTSGIAFFATGLILYMSVSQPTKDLAEALTDISEGEGDLTVELIVRRDDELGKIETSFNTFLSHIRKVISDVKDTAVKLSNLIEEMKETSTSIATNVKDQAAAAEEVSATVEEITAGGEQVAHATKDQLDSLSTLSDKLEILSGHIDQVSQRLEDTVQMTENFADKARGGETLLLAMEESMKKIFNSSAEIQSIVTIIADISEQINLLSLNASIEAARAGDHGKGFAVVADEISKLADATARSLGDIDKLINANNDEIKTGLSNVNQTVEMLSDIIEGFSEIRAMMEKLSGVMESQLSMKNDVSKTAADVLGRSEAIQLSTEEQQLSMSEISQSIQNINEISQSNAEGVEHIAEKSKTIKDMSELLNQEVEFFKV